MMMRSALLCLVALDLMRERDQALALAQEYDALLSRLILADARTPREHWEELDQLRNRLRLAGWIPDTLALNGELSFEPRCPKCGLRLTRGQPCLLCGPAADSKA
jgi:hypothetical protein